MSEHTKGEMTYTFLNGTKTPATLYIVDADGEDVDIAVFDDWGDGYNQEQFANARRLVKCWNEYDSKNKTIDELVGSCEELIAIIQRYEPHASDCATQADPEDFGHLGCTCKHGRLIKAAQLALKKAKGE